VQHQERKQRQCGDEKDSRHEWALTGARNNQPTCLKCGRVGKRYSDLVYGPGIRKCGKPKKYR
jgi:hypothetical protein